MGRELGDRTAWQRCAHVGPEFDCVDFNQLVNRSCEAIGDLANVALNSYFFFIKKNTRRRSAGGVVPKSANGGCPAGSRHRDDVVGELAECPAVRNPRYVAGAGERRGGGAAARGGCAWRARSARLVLAALGHGWERERCVVEGLQTQGVAQRSADACMQVAPAAASAGASGAGGGRQLQHQIWALGPAGARG